MNNKYVSTLHFVENRGRAPSSFLDELISWGKTATDEIFAPNDNPADAYAAIKLKLATPSGRDSNGKQLYKWDNLLHRRAAMLELMRVHAGLESSWNWKEAVDKSNPTSMQNKSGQETGIFQVSFDSEFLGSPDEPKAMSEFAFSHGIETADKFIPAMKSDHTLAMEYYARLVRVSIRWAGPLIRSGDDSVYPHLRKDAMWEFASFLK